MSLRQILTAFFVCFLCISSSLPAQHLIEAEFISNTPATQILNLPGIPRDYDVDAYRLIYQTRDVHGDTTVASGLIVVPAHGPCNSFPMGVYCHGTVLKKQNIPSQENSEATVAKVFSSAGYIALAPDYLGYGASPGLHPYHHARSEATATLDMIRAARDFLEDKSIEDNGEVFITGYSQGGHAAMASLQYAQENELLDELGIVAGAPASGAYYLSETQADPLINESSTYEFMGYAVFLTLAYQKVYGNIYRDINDFFEDEYIDDINQYFDGMQNQYEMAQVHLALPNMADKLLEDSVLQELQTNPDHPLWQAYRANDNYDWKPEMPLRLFYCSGDEQVSPENSLEAELAMNQNGAADVVAKNSLPGAGHGNCVLPALLDVYQFFTGKASPCTMTAVSDKDLPKNLMVYPNPATASIHLENLASITRIQITNSQGILQSDHFLPSGREELTIPIHDLSSGLYFLQFHGADGLMGAKKVVVQ